MKNTKFTYALLVVVLLLWIMIIHRFFWKSSPEELVARHPEEPSISPMLPIIEHADTLILAYRDPFLVGAEVSEAGHTDLFDAINYPFEEVPLVDWTLINYLGSVVSDGGEDLLLVSINSRDYMLRVGEIVEGYKLVQKLGDSIKISYQGQIGHITKKGHNEN